MSESRLATPRSRLRSTAALGLLAALAAMPPRARAQDVVASDFTGTSPAQNTPWTRTSQLAPGLAFSGWTLGPGAIAAPGVDDAFAFSVNAPGLVDSPLTESLAEAEYVGFTLTPTAGVLDLGGRKIELTLRRDSWHAPMRFALFTSIDGFAEGQELFATPSTGKGDFAPHDRTFIVPLAGYDGLTGPTEFRLHAFEAQWGGHVVGLTSFRIVQPGPLHALSLVADGPGTVSSSPSGSLHEEGTVLTLSAVPAAGSRFVGWTGDVTGTGNPRNLVMDAPRSVTARFEGQPAPCMAVGMNLSGVVDWGTDWAFVDVFKKSRQWLTRSVGGAEWDSNRGGEIPLDANGWPLEVPFTAPSDGSQHVVHTLLPVPVAGDYVMLLEGAGTLELWGPVPRGQLTAPGGGESRFVIPIVPGAEGTLFVNLLASDATDPLRNIRVIMPGFEATYLAEPFHPLFLESLAGSSLLRFMDWGSTNASPLTAWSARTTPASATQTRAEGASLEHATSLANRLGQDAWTCVPHAADDDFVRRTARAFRDGLSPKLRIWVEYSNETWNTAGPFSQTTYVQDRGEALGLAPDRWTAGQRFVALRSAEIWRIFEEELAAQPQRLVKVLATQVANVNVTNLRVAALLDPSLNPLAVMPDTLAVAPYFGRNFAPADLPPNAPSYPTVDSILTVDAPAAIAVTRGWTASQRVVADTQGWSLTCYEGGQHFVGVAGAEGDDTLTAILQEANRDPRMGPLYQGYLDGLQQAGVTLFANFSHVGAWSRWGSWSLLERQDQPASEAPKYQAFMDWIGANSFTVLRAAQPQLVVPGGAPPIVPVRDVIARPCRSPHVVPGDALVGAREPLAYYAIAEDVRLDVRRAVDDVVLDWR